MKFGPVAPREALGGTAVHSIRQGDLVLKKGTLIGAAEVAALELAGVAEIVVARLDVGDVSEDQAAGEIAAAVAGAAVPDDRTGIPVSGQRCSAWRCRTHPKCRPSRPWRSSWRGSSPCGSWRRSW